MPNIIDYIVRSCNEKKYKETVTGYQLYIQSYGIDEILGEILGRGYYMNVSKTVEANKKGKLDLDNFAIRESKYTKTDANGKTVERTAFWLEVKGA